MLNLNVMDRKRWDEEREIQKESHVIEIRYHLKFKVLCNYSYIFGKAPLGRWGTCNMQSKCKSW